MVARGAHVAHHGSPEPLLGGSRSNDLRLVTMRRAALRRDAVVVTHGVLPLLTKELPRMELDSQRIVVLGGTSGIGHATAQLAAAEGATVVIASSNAERVDSALANLPVNAEGYALDLRREE